MTRFFVLVGFIIVFCLFIEVRYTCFHFIEVLKNACIDMYYYIKHKRYNEFNGFGEMNMYIADSEQPFGCGKTCNVVNKVINIYKQYNDKEVWCDKRKCFVTQKVIILSNITLYNVPYIPLVNHQQIIQASEEEKEEGIEKVYIVVLDEMGTQFNNREWKNNLSTDLLNAILQQRKNKMAIYGTVQDYSLFDATLRKLCAKVYVCTKRWRFLKMRQYWAKDLERVDGNTKMLQCIKYVCSFATDKLYHSYDTTEKVQKISKDIENGDMLTNEEILRHSDSNSNIDTLTNIKRKYKKRVTH